MKKRVVYPRKSSGHDDIVSRKVVVIVVVGLLLISGLVGLFYYAEGTAAWKYF